MNKARCFAIAAAVLALLAVGLSSARVHAGDDDIAAIRGLCSTFVSSWNKHDAAGMAGVFAEKGDLIGPDGIRNDGRKAVAEALAMWHGEKGPMRSSTAKVIDEPVHLITADVAISDADVIVSNVMDKDGAASDLPLHVTNIWKKTNGAWALYASRPYVKEKHEN